MEKRHYTAVISYVDGSRGKPYLMIERIAAKSSREALQVAKRRARRHRVVTGDIQIIRGEAVITGIYSPRRDSDPAHFCGEEAQWTEEETQNQFPFVL